jgi:hypothetical protein
MKLKSSAVAIVAAIACNPRQSIAPSDTAILYTRLNRIIQRLR